MILDPYQKVMPLSTPVWMLKWIDGIHFRRTPVSSNQCVITSCYLFLVSSVHVVSWI